MRVAERNGETGQKTGREGRNVVQDDDSNVQTLGRGWRGVGEIRTFIEASGVHVNRLGMGDRKLLVRRGGLRRVTGEIAGLGLLETRGGRKEVACQKTDTGGVVLEHRQVTV